MKNMEISMYCNQCKMSSPGGCGSEGQTTGTCLKDANLSCLQDIIIYGVKGLAAYREHARELGADTLEVDDIISESLYFTLTNVNFDFNQHIAQLMKLGDAGIKVMNLLSDAHTNRLGTPSPVSISQNYAEGKAILVSGHNLEMLQNLLKQTTNRGVNIYTHSEMLPAHSYPELNKYPHLKGNIGRSWFDQRELFEKWSGAIVVNTNCIMPEKETTQYSNRLFTYKITGAPNTHKITNDDFEPLIQKALELPEITGFDSKATLVTGHHYKSVLDLAPNILEAIEKKQIRKFFVVAGCDAPGNAGNYFRDITNNIPKDCVILTSSCGKFRFNDIDFGNIEGTDIPRYLDLGQCNDSIGAVHIASALSNATGIPINHLPVSIILSWMEQKAVIILLALLSLNIKNIYIGPTSPEFINTEVFTYLEQTFGLSVTNSANEDLGKLLVN
ncbi:MAG: hydroxylamine reductase [Candidatus Thiodiazotropha sp.]